MPPALEAWHNIIRSKNLNGLNDLIATDAVFYSPLIHTPQTGRERVVQYLAVASQVFLNDSFRYVREFIELNEAMLEFKVVIDDIEVDGIDHIKWNDEDQIVSSKVWVRPLKAIQIVQQKMTVLLAC